MDAGSHGSRVYVYSWLNAWQMIEKGANFHQDPYSPSDGKGNESQDELGKDLDDSESEDESGGASGSAKDSSLKHSRKQRRAKPKRVSGGRLPFAFSSKEWYKA